MTCDEKRPLGAIYLSAAPEFVREILRLPDNYDVAGFAYDADRCTITLIVANDDLPRVDDGELLPEVKPIYRQETINDISQVVLDRIEVEDVSKRPRKNEGAT